MFVKASSLKVKITLMVGVEEAKMDLLKVSHRASVGIPINTCLPWSVQWGEVPTQVCGKHFPTKARGKDFPTQVPGKDFPTDVRRNCILSIILRGGQWASTWSYLP